MKLTLIVTIHKIKGYAIQWFVLDTIYNEFWFRYGSILTMLYNGVGKNVFLKLENILNTYFNTNTYILNNS